MLWYKTLLWYETKLWYQLAKTKPTKLEFTAQLILIFNFHFFMTTSFFLFTCQVKLVYLLTRHVYQLWSNFLPDWITSNYLSVLPTNFTSTTCHFEVGWLQPLSRLTSLTSSTSQVGSLNRPCRFTLVEIYRVFFLV